MTALYGANYTDEYVSVPSVKGGNGEYGGNLITFIDEYIITATLPDTADTIQICKLRAGMRVIGVKLLGIGTMSGTGTLTVGFDSDNTTAETDDADGFATTWDISAGNSIGGSTPPFNLGALVGKKLGADGSVYAYISEDFAGHVAADKLVFALIVADN